MKSRLLFITVIILSFGMLYACAPEEPENERDEQAVQDSVEQAFEEEREQMRRDSIEQARQDSLRAEQQREMERNQIEYSEDGDYVVQVEAWRSEEKAQQQADEWVNMGYDEAYVVSYGNEDTGDVWYRVRIGHFNNREMAESLQTQLNEEYDAVSWVSRTDDPVEEEAMQEN